MNLPELNGIYIAVTLLAAFVVCATYLVRKHGGVRNALYGNPLAGLGTVTVIGIEPKKRETSFRVAFVRPQGRRPQVIVEITDSDSTSWSKQFISLTSDESAAVAKLLQEASARTRS